MTDDKRHVCPSCNHLALVGIEGAEVTAPILYMCTYCHEACSPEEYLEAQLARVACDEEPAKVPFRDRVVRALGELRG